MEIVLDTRIREQINITKKKKKANKHGPTAKQMEVKTNRTEVLRGNHSGHYNMEMKTSVHVTGQHEQHEPN